MNFHTKAEQLAALCAPFPKHLVKTRDQKGMTLHYYPVEVVRSRLREVFGADYEFRTGRPVVTETTVDMPGTLTLRWVDGSTTVVEDWGSSDILHSRNNGSRVNDPYKNCSSDSLKRCLAFVGCGAELYDEDYRQSLESDGEVIGSEGPGETKPKSWEDIPISRFLQLPGVTKGQLFGRGSSERRAELAKLVWEQDALEQKGGTK